MNNYKLNFGLIHNRLLLTFKKFNLFRADSLVSSLTLLSVVSQFDCERAFNRQVGFQVPTTPVMEGIIDFHHDLVFFLLLYLDLLCGF